VLGRAGFPTAVKPQGRPEQKLHTLIINGTECEPYITADEYCDALQAAESRRRDQNLMHIPATLIRC